MLYFYILNLLLDRNIWSLLWLCDYLGTIQFAVKLARMSKRQIAWPARQSSIMVRWSSHPVRSFDRLWALCRSFQGGGNVIQRSHVSGYFQSFLCSWKLINWYYRSPFPGNRRSGSPDAITWCPHEVYKNETWPHPENGQIYNRVKDTCLNRH